MKRALVLLLTLCLILPIAAAGEQVDLDALMQEIDKGAKALTVSPATYEISPDRQSVFIDRPEISGAAEYTIAYNIYDSDSNPVNYFYSDEARVAATPGYAGLFNVFIVVTDTDTGEQNTQNIGWHELLGPDSTPPTATSEPTAEPSPTPEILQPLKVEPVTYEISGDARHIFIDRPVITGGSGTVSIAYNIYDSDAVPVNYFYSDEARVAATPGYAGLFNVFVVVTDIVTVEGDIQNIGWHEMLGETQSFQVTVDGDELTVGMTITSMMDHIYGWPAIEGAVSYGMSADGSTNAGFFTEDTRLKIYFLPYAETVDIRVMAFDGDERVIGSSEAIHVILQKPETDVFTIWPEREAVQAGNYMPVYAERNAYLRATYAKNAQMCGGGYRATLENGQYKWLVETDEVCDQMLCWAEDEDGHISNIVSFRVSTEPVEPEQGDWPVTVNGIIYDYVGGRVTVTGREPDVTELVFVDEVNGLPVRAIAQKAFEIQYDDEGYMSDPLTGSLKFPSKLESIGAYAFSDMDGLTGELVLPETIRYIGAFAFWNCTGLTGSLTIPAGVEKICDGAFGACRGITGTLSLPEGLQRIEANTFERTPFSGKLVIPTNVKYIGNYAFTDCSGFSDASIPDNCVIGYGVFKGTKLTVDQSWPGGWLKTVDGVYYYCTGGEVQVDGAQPGEAFPRIREEVNGLPVTVIGGWAFSNNTWFTGTLTIPSSITRIDSCAFQACSGLTGPLTIPDSVTRLEYCAFAYCTGFSGELTLPANIEYIGNMCFIECAGLTGSVHIPEGCSVGTDAFEGTGVSIE